MWPPLRAPAGASDAVRGTNPEQQITAAELAPSYRALRMLSDSNKSLICARDEATLLHEICRIAVEVGNYRMAWVGFAKDDVTRTVQPLAHAGADDGYLASAEISWGEGCAGPIARAIATGKPCIVRNIREDPAFSSRREAATSRGYQSAIALPLVIEGRAFGAFEIYATEGAAFESHEVEILNELAADVAYGVTALRTRAERDRAAEALRESNRQLEAAQRLAHVGHWYRDLRTHAVTWSDETYRIFGRVPRQPMMASLTPQELLEIIHPDDRVRVFQAFRAAVEGGPPYNIDYRIRRPSGEVRFLHVEGEVERDAQGQPLRLFGVILDITELTQVEESLRKAERLFRTIVDNLPDLVSRFDAQGRYSFISQSLVRASGAAPTAFLGRKPRELELCDDPASSEALSASIEAVLATGNAEQLEVDFALPDGPRPFEVRHVPEKDENGVVVSVLGIARDLTPARAAARQLYLLNYALDHASDGIFLMRGGSPAFHYVNHAGAQSLGYSVPELTSGLSVLEINPEMTEERWQLLVQEVKRDRRLTIETTHRSRGGHILPVEVTANYFEFERQSYNLAIARDMTERKAARQLEEQLRQAQKMEAVGQLAGGIAHDFNNILAVIQMESSLLLEEGNVNLETRDSLHEILAASERAANLTRQLLMFSRRQVVRLVDLDLCETVSSVLRLLRRVLGENIAVKSSFARAPTFIHGDPGMMEQVLMNLAINARDAMPNGGELTVRLEPTRIPEGEGRLYVCLSVSDTGCGIPSENLPRIFEPFFTTKELGKGTGLGLATVFGIVQQHHGRIEVDSVLGQHTTFRVLLPALEASRSPKTIVPAATAVRGGTETILVVEDDPAVRATVATALKRCGYRVLQADTAASALRIGEDLAQEIDLLLTDLVMPGGVSGCQLAERLRAFAPALKVLYTSGYTPEIVAPESVLEANQELLQKPYTVAVLAASVRQCLDGPPRTDAR
jgi:two-component system, cell cycle sensor histidine kinase and response regulator CckA